MRSFVRSLLPAAAAAGSLLAFEADAAAQQDTFYLDRIQVAGGPEDGMAIWRPEFHEKVRIFGQLGVGFQLHPLRLENEVENVNIRKQADSVSGNPVDWMLTGYASIGVEFLRRFQFQVSLPFAPYVEGNPTSPQGLTNELPDNASVDKPAVMDMRLELRGVPYFTNDRLFKLGANMAVWVPSGTTETFSGDGKASGGFGLTGELDFQKKFILTLNTFAHFRPKGGLNDFALEHELRYGLAGYAPLREGAIRIGLEVFGSASLVGTREGKRADREANFPIEWMLQGRFAPDEKKRLWIGVGAGTRMSPGYAPDLRALATIGYGFPILDTNPKSPDPRVRIPEPAVADADKDGLPDDIDLCPNEPEDHKPPNPDDGCPTPPDKDGDGIPDAVDQCPDKAEDFDKVDDKDGCPETDADEDGIPDATDACPKEPGEANPVAEKNGCPQFIKRIEGSSEIQILKQVQFQTGSAKILQNSFVILDEVVRLLKVNPDIAKLSIEGHTDNRGSDQLNEKLSADRAKSCMDYLIKKGIDAKRLTSSGFGPRKPIDDNKTDAGRQRNRRTEFHIVEQLTGPPPKDDGKKGPTLPD